VNPLLEKLRAQRIDPLARALGATSDGLPPARRLIVLPSPSMARIPVEVLLAPDDTRTVSYAPSGTVYKYLCEQPRPARQTGLLALGDPDYGRPNRLAEPATLPDHGLPLNVVSAARAGAGDFGPLPGTRQEVETLAHLFQSDDRPTQLLLGIEASEPQLVRLAASNELGKFGFIHVATHGVIDESDPQRSAVILTQTGLPDPLDQVLNHKPVFDGRLSVREIQSAWSLNAELVTLSACETAMGPVSGGESFVGFTQALLISGARSVCLSLWKVDDKATSLLMTRFYQNLLGKRSELSKPMPKAEALHEAKHWLRKLTADQVDRELLSLDRGGVRPLAKDTAGLSTKAPRSPNTTEIHPYDHPYYWASFVLVGDPD
jgi:CHAT domain-containing protein